MKPRITLGSRLLADGAWGSGLAAMGLEPGGCPELWNVERPDRVRALADSFVRAGSRVLLTNTFGAGLEVLGRRGLAGRMDEVNRRGAEIARAAAGPDTLVLGSIGPFGRLLSMDEAGDEEVAGSVRRQAAALLAGGADGIVLETMADLAEATLAVRTIKALRDAPVVVSLSFEHGPPRLRTMLGVSPELAARECAAAGADAIGCNCRPGLDGALEACRALRAASGLPVWIKPGAGRPDLLGERVVYPLPPLEFADRVPGLLDAGANVIGGCCGVTAEHIRQACRIMDL